MSRIAASIGALAALFLAGEAAASVTVLGGGFAEACSRYAILGHSERRFEAECNRALEDEVLDRSDRAGTFVNRGVMKMRRMEYEAAKRDFDAAVRLKPDIGEAYVNRGAAFIGLKRYDLGLVDLNKGIEIGIQPTETAKAYYNRAMAHEGVGDPKAAYFDYLKAQELSPDWLAPRNELQRFTVSRP